MCEIKYKKIATALYLAAGSCTYQVKSEKNVRHHSEIKSESVCEKEYKKYCLNGGECFYLFGEVFVGCYSTSFFGGNRCEKYMWWT